MTDEPLPAGWSPVALVTVHKTPVISPLPVSPCLSPNRCSFPLDFRWSFVRLRVAEARDAVSWPCDEACLKVSCSTFRTPVQRLISEASLSSAPGLDPSFLLFNRHATVCMLLPLLLESSRADAQTFQFGILGLVAVDVILIFS